MTVEKEIEDRIRHKAATGDFFEQLLMLSKSDSDDLHEDFIDNLKNISVYLRKLFESEGFIEHISNNAKDFWKGSKGRRAAFVDGGVARVDIPSSAPMGIRVGSYFVELGNEGEDREHFKIEASLVDELYSYESRTYEDVFDDLEKMTDAARIAAEVSAALRIVRRENDLHCVLVHGPLVNPVAPYGTPGFPRFTEDCAKALLDGAIENFADKDDRHFVRVYRRALELIGETDTPVLGVVERSRGRSARLIRALLSDLEKSNRIKRSDAAELEDQLEAYRLNDAIIFSVLLSEAEYSRPFPINPQQPQNKWPDDWKTDIRKYPDAWTTYMKSSDSSEPFRIEMLTPPEENSFPLNLVYFNARLLPNYGFPVGLDIIDRYAKVPGWMTKGIRSQHAVTLLKKALATGDPKTIEYAKRMLAAQGRDWLFRPKA